MKRGEEFSESVFFGKAFYKKGNSVKRFGPLSEPPESENNFFCAHPLPENQLLKFRVPELNLFLRTAFFGTLNIANRRFEDIRANRANVTKIP